MSSSIADLTFDRVGETEGAMLYSKILDLRCDCHGVFVVTKVWNSYEKFPHYCCEPEKDSDFLE